MATRVLILWAAFTASEVLAEDSAQAQRPNIVLVMADDLGWSDVGCYGGEIPTPHIDSLAQGGLRFTQFYNNAICGPTRASLLTGLYPQQVGHRGDRWNEPKDYTKCVTIAEVLQSSGYRTMMVGKWGTGSGGGPRLRSVLWSDVPGEDQLLSRGSAESFLS